MKNGKKKYQNLGTKQLRSFRSEEEFMEGNV